MVFFYFFTYFLNSFKFFYSVFIVKQHMIQYKNANSNSLTLPASIERSYTLKYIFISTNLYKIHAKPTHTHGTCISGWEDQYYCTCICGRVS